MKGQVLAVDFEKRELKDTQHKSENDKQSFYINKTKICNDAVTIVMKYLNKEASNDALLKCYVGLKKAADDLEENGFVNINYHNNRRLADMLLAEIEDKVVEEI